MKMADENLLDPGAPGADLRDPSAFTTSSYHDGDAAETRRTPSIVLIGTSFKSAPIAFRERVSKGLLGIGREALLAGTPGVLESSVIETCNRVEMYIAASDPVAASESLLARLDGESDRFYVKSGLDAITHMFRVASGLDSVVLGEDQILQQVRGAGRKARVSGTAKSALSPLFDAAFSVGGRVRQTYTVPPSRRSLSAFALSLALRELGRPPRSVLLIGTGQTAKLAALELDKAKIYVLSRRRDAGPRFAGATRVRGKDLRKVAAECDLIVSATRHAGYLLHRRDVPDDRKRIILDLAFPRNVDPGLKSSGLVKLYDLDDIAKAVGPLLADPELEASERLVAAEAERFNGWLVATRFTPTLAGIYRWAETIREDEVGLAIRRLPGLSEKERRVLEVMSRRLVSKLMAPHAAFAKQKGGEMEQPERLRLLESIFGEDDP
jgi:glutamyl-tRNA reductase